MTIYEQIRSTVTARQAAEQYGMKVTSNGLTCCPFHNDHAPSMKIAERYYCFACGATGDVINLVQQLFGCGAYPAAIRLAADFHIPIGTETLQNTPAEQRPPNIRMQIREAAGIILQYRNLIETWKTQYAPDMEDEQWDPRFSAALEQSAFIEYLLDGLLSPFAEESEEFYRTYREQINQYKEDLRKEGENEQYL